MRARKFAAIPRRDMSEILADLTADPELAIIVVSYNTREMTIECLRSVYRETETPFELIVVDNASPDGSAEAIRDAFPSDKYPNLTLIAEETNHGFAPAHDIAVPRSQAPWVLLLNPDTVVLERALDKLLAFGKRTPDAGIWGGRTIFGDGRLNTTSCWRAMNIWTVFCRTTGLTGIFPRSGLFNAEEYAGWKRDSERQVDIVTGCLFMIRREDWDRLGGFDPAFVMYGEEADLCMRARAEGFRPRISPEVEIIHYGAASEPVAADRVVRVLRAKAELIKRHFSPITRPIGAFLFMVFPKTRQIATGLGGRLLSKPHLTTQSQVWGEVWKRRAEWKDGFPT